LPGWGKIFFEKSAQPQKSSRKLHTNMKIRGKRFIPFIVAYLLQVIALGAWGQGSPPGSVPGLRLKPPQWTSPAPAWALQDPAAPASIFPAGLERQAAGSVALLAMAHASENLVSADFYARHVGFFCKKEWQWEKASGIPLRLRLGSVDYCDFLEGKTLHSPQP
jgi:hypothetical protein